MRNADGSHRPLVVSALMYAKQDRPTIQSPTQPQVSDRSCQATIRAEVQGGGVVQDLRLEDPTISDANHLGKAFCEQKHQTSHD